MNKTNIRLNRVMKQDKLKCNEDSDCNYCSCQNGLDDCIYNHITTVADYIRNMDINTLATFLHSWQGEKRSVETIKELLVGDYSDYTRNI